MHCSNTTQYVDFTIAPNNDILVSAKPLHSCGQATVHVLSAAHQYQKFNKHAKTALTGADDTHTLLFGPHNDLYIIKRSKTGSNSTEVHVLSASSNYSSFTTQTGTALSEVDNHSHSFMVAANGDIYVIKKSNTGSKSTEVHVLTAASGYKSFGTQTGTALEETDDTYAFLLAQNNDIYCIKKSNTGSKSTEVHVLTAASGYKSFGTQTGTALEETDDTYAFLLAQNNDIYCIKKSKTGSNSTEIHVLTAASGYKSFGTQTGTALHETDFTFAFAIGGNNDIYAIKKVGGASHSSEVHVLSADSGYKKFSMQTKTNLAEIL